MRLAKILLAVGIAFYFFGPPWYVSAFHGAVDYHEDVHLGGLQAIRMGDVPYIRAAAVQYGPGTQLAMYVYMRTLGGFSLVGFRETFALFHWLGATLFLVVVFARLRFVWAALAGFLAILVFPTLELFGFVPGAYFGFFGWGNVLRYTGVFALALLFAPAIECSNRARRLLAGAGIGVIWGATTYIAQENLVGGLIALAALSILFVFSQTYPPAALARVVGGIALGSALVWAPVIAYYAWHGLLWRFVQLYFLIPSEVARGYSNTAYLEGWDSPWGRMYYVLPFLLAVLAILSTVQLHPLRFARRWERERILLVSVVVVASVCDQASMLRADSSHLYNTMLAVPVLFVVAAVYLPRVMGIRRPAPMLALSAGVVAVALVLVPSTSYTIDGLRQRLSSPYDVRRALANLPQPPPLARGAASRVGPGLAEAPLCCSRSAVTMTQLIRVMDRLHALVGKRVTYVGGFRDAYPGLVYFLADLRPAPILVEPYTMVVTQRMQQQYLSDFAQHIGDIQAEVVTNPTSQEALDFKSAYKRYRIIKLPYPRAPLYVLLRS